MFIVALFIIVKRRKLHKCPLIGERIKKMRYIHTMEYYSALKGRDTYYNIGTPL